MELDKAERDRQREPEFVERIGLTNLFKKKEKTMASGRNPLFSFLS
jgi:hypothetical protein